MRVLYAFIRSTFHTTYIYRFDFWVRLVSAAIMMYATYSLWSILYTQTPDAFGLDRARMTTYGVIGVVLFAVLISVNFVRYYISDKVRDGTLELDLLKPIDFLFHMLGRNIGEMLMQALFYGLPAYLFARFVLGIEAPASTANALAFLASLLLGFLVFFHISLLIGLISVVTLKIDSYIWVFIGLTSFASGQIVPLWMFPPGLRAVLDLLPFKYIFFVPMTIYIGAQETSLAVLLRNQAAWVLVLFAGAVLFWSGVRRRIVVQGG